MAQPITWQNIHSPSLAEASRPLEAAQRSFSNMFDGLGAVLKDAEVRGEEGRNILRDRNADTLRDLFANAKTPEQVAAAQQQAATLRAQMGDMVRAGDVRGLDEKRLIDVRNQQKQGIEFDNLMKDERSMPHMQAFKAAAVRGDKIGMAAAEAAYNQAGGRNLADLVAYADSRDWMGKERDETVNQWGRNKVSHEDHLKTTAMNRSASQAQIAASADQRSMLKEERLAKQTNDLYDRLGKVKNDTVDSEQGITAITKFINDNYADPGTRASLLTRASEYAAKGVLDERGNKIPITVDAMQKAIGATKDTRWTGTHWLNDSDQGDSIGSNLATIVTAPEYANRLLKTSVQEDRVIAEIQRLQEKNAPKVTARAGANNFFPDTVANPLEDERPLVNPAAGGVAPQAVVNPLDDMEAVPPKPAAKVWRGNDYIDNPEYVQWSRRYGARYAKEQEARIKDFANRMTRASSRG